MFRPTAGLLVIAALVSAALIAGCASRSGPASRVVPSSASTSASAPDFSLTDLSGNKFKLSDQKGKVVFLNFFATWCGPCRAEMPELVKMNGEYDASKVKVVSVSVDDERSVADVKPFAQKYDVRHTVLSGTDAQNVGREFGVSGIPANFLIGPDGRIIQQWEGYTPEEPAEWREAISSALGST